MEDAGASITLCTIGSSKFALALCDLDAIISMMLLVVYKKLGLGSPQPISMSFLIEDYTMMKLVGILCYVLVKVASFILLADFIILDFELTLKFLLYSEGLSSLWVGYWLT